MQRERELDDTEERVKASINLRDGDAYVAMTRITNLFNVIYEAGFYELGITPRWGAGFTGDAALVLERRGLFDPAPLFDPAEQIRMQKLMIDENSERFSAPDFQPKDASGRPVYLVIEGRDFNKKVIGFEWRAVVIYQPHEPEVLNYIPAIAEEIRKNYRRNGLQARGLQAKRS